MLKRKRYLPIDDYLEALSTPVERKQKRDQFYENIRFFYRRKWGCPFKVPAVNGREFDLFELYDAVLSLGGWQKVTALDRWNEVLQKLRIDENIQMAEYAIRFLYMRFLSKFEQSESGNDLNEEHENELLAGRANRFKGLNSMSMQPSYAEPPFSAPKASNDAPVPDFHKLAFALLSGLPNEVSFGLNVLTVLSHPGAFVLNFTNCPQLISLLVALCGVNVIVEDLDNLSSLYEWWHQSSSYDFVAFWANAGIEEDDLLPFVYNPTGISLNPSLDWFETAASFFTDDDRLDLTTPINWRIFNVLAIFHNLSFEEFNITPMGENRALIRLLLLCCNCRWQHLNKIAFETLSNIAKNINLSTQLDAPSVVPIKKMCLNTIRHGLHSDDKFQVMRSMEIVAGLCAMHENETIICDFFEETRSISRIFSLLTVKDILICICAIETMLQISELGRTTCDAIADCKHAIDILVDLLTTDAVSFGITGLSGMQVVEVRGHHTQPYVSPKKNQPPSLKLQPIQLPTHQQHTSLAEPSTSQSATTAPIDLATQHPVRDMGRRVSSHQLQRKVYLKPAQPLSSEMPFQNGIATPVPLASALSETGQEYFCEWMMQMDVEDDWSNDEAGSVSSADGPIEPCARLFPTAPQMLYHVYNEHLVPLVQQQNGCESPKIRCRWPLCDNTLRTLWSITTHLQDIHCTESALEQAMRRRQEMGYQEYVTHLCQQFDLSRERPPPQSGYSDFAAQEAIRRHAFTNLKKEIVDDSEGPVTRSIRLTAALVLRNLCRHSVSGRLQLRKYESFLSWMSLSRMESARALAQCLNEVVRHSNGDSGAELLNPTQNNQTEEEQSRQSNDFASSEIAEAIC